MRNVWLPAWLFHDRAFQGLSNQAKLLFFYLHINPQSNLAGVFCLPSGYVKADLGRDFQELKGELLELHEAGLVTRCPSTDWVWLRRHLQFEPARGEKQIGGFMKIAAQVPSDCSWHADFKRHIHDNVWTTRERG